MSDNVKFRLTNLGTQFDRTEDSGYSREEWRRMTERERRVALNNFVFESVNASVVED